MVKYMEKNLDITKPRYSEQTLHVPCGGGPSLCRGSTFFYHYPYKPPYPLLLTRWEAHAEIAGSRLRDSKARGTEKARTRKKKREKSGERGRRRKWLQALSPFLFLFPVPLPFSRALHFRVFPTIWEPGTGWSSGESVARQMRTADIKTER